MYINFEYAQTHSNYTDAGSADFANSNFLVEKDSRRGDDEDWGEGEKGGDGP